MKRLLAIAAFWIAWASPLLAQSVDPVVQSADVFPGVDGGQTLVRLEATQVFWDDFGTGTLDTTNRWTASTGGGGNATSATNAVGNTVIGSGTQASGYSLLTSIPTFAGRNPGYITGQWQVNFEAPPIITGAYRAWGYFTNPGTPTLAAPLSNAVVFAIDTNGKLRAQTWGSGTINVNIDLSIRITSPDSCNCVPQPTDSAVHKYQITFRGDNILWWVDGRLVARVLTGAGGPDVNTLGTAGLAVNGLAATSASATIQFNQVTIGDSSRNNIRVCDSIFSFRCQTVTSSGGTGTATIGATVFGTSQIAVPTTPGILVAAARTGAAGTGRKSICVTNITGTSPVYISGTTPVTSSVGMFIPGTAGAAICLDTQSIVYGISGGGTQTVSYSETY